MGTHVIKMPDIGEGIAEVELSQWHVKVCYLVVEDQVLADHALERGGLLADQPARLPDARGLHHRLLALLGEQVQVHRQFDERIHQRRADEHEAEHNELGE